MRAACGLEVWHVDMGWPWQTSELLHLLDDKERAQAARFRFVHLAETYIVAHAALRSVLAQWVGQRPQDLVFDVNAYGKPHMAQPGAPVFSLSHTVGAALCAVAPSGDIGVDIEKQRPLAHDDLVGRFFSVAEVQQFDALPPDQQEAGFFSGWTRKEAYIKAKGLGLSLPLNQFSVEMSPQLEPSLRSSEWACEDVARFRIWDLPVRAGYRAALAYAGPLSGPPSCHDWLPSFLPSHSGKD
jgi:4'-phosphopantetheinyl transferase